MHVPVELKMKYLQRRTQDIEKLRGLVKHDDFKEAAKLGHQVKGNAVTFEFPHMTSVGIEIEKAANAKDLTRLEILLDQMESMIAEAKSTLH